MPVLGLALQRLYVFPFLSTWKAPMTPLPAHGSRPRSCGREGGGTGLRSDHVAQSSPGTRNAPSLWGTEVDGKYMSMFPRGVLRPLCWSNLAFAKSKKAGFKHYPSMLFYKYVLTPARPHEGLERCTPQCSLVFVSCWLELWVSFLLLAHIT